MARRAKKDPPTPAAAEPPVPSTPPAPEPVNHASTHTFAYGKDGATMACPCGAEQDLRLVDGKAARFYRVKGGPWERAIAVCPRYAPPPPPPPPPPAAETAGAPESPAQSRLAEVLSGALREQYPEAFAPEIINGSNVEEAARMVELDIACSPVLPYRAPADPLADAGGTLIPAEVTPLDGGLYRVFCHDEAPRDVSADVVKLMRARFLLRRGELARALPSMDVRSRERWMHLYRIPWMPPADSPLGRQVQTGEVITIKLEEGKPLDLAALMKTLATPGAAIPDVCPTLEDTSR